MNNILLIKYKILFLFFIMVFHYGLKAQDANDSIVSTRDESYGIQYNPYLLEPPVYFYNGFTISYSKKIVGEKRVQLFVSPQIGRINIPNVEKKIIFSGILQYKYVSKKRFEASVSLGLNYILTRLDYDRYEYENNVFTNKGKLLHQIAPSTGFNVGYKVIKRQKFSLSPFVGVSIIKLNKTYQPNLFAGYKPDIIIGINLNR